MGTLYPLSPRRARALPLKLPPKEPLLFTDFRHDSDLADWWTILFGTWAIIDGELDVTQVAADCYCQAGDIAWSDYVFECKVQFITATDGLTSIVRWQDVLNHYWCRLRAASGDMIFVRRLAGVDALLAFVVFAWVVGTWYDVRIEVRGDNLRVYVDGALLVNVVDPTPILTGSICLNSYNTHGRFDDVYVRR